MRARSRDRKELAAFVFRLSFPPGPASAHLSCRSRHRHGRVVPSERAHSMPRRVAGTAPPPDRAGRAPPFTAYLPLTLA